MERQRGAQTLLIAVLAVAVLAMSIGFAAAAYTQTLNINGNITAKAAKWSVHFDTDAAKYSETSGEGYVTASSDPAATHTLSTTSWTFSATLEPGETYEATAHVVNDGTFDAKLVGITMSSLSAAEAKYLTYTLDYNGTSYTASASNLNVVLPKAEGTTNGDHTVKVKVAYIIPSDAADLPTTDQTVTLTASLNYESVVQAGA